MVICITKQSNNCNCIFSEHKSFVTFITKNQFLSVQFIKIVIHDNIMPNWENKGSNTVLAGNLKMWIQIVTNESEKGHIFKMVKIGAKLNMSEIYILSQFN